LESFAAKNNTTPREIQAAVTENGIDRKGEKSIKKQFVAKL